MKVFVAVSCIVLLAIGFIAPGVAGPLARVAGIVLVTGITVTVVWPLVTRYPQRNSPAPVVAAAPFTSSLPIELQRLTDEAASGQYGGRTVGYDTLLHLRYVGRFRLIVGHRLDPDDPSDFPKIQTLTGTNFAAIVGVWPPDVRGEAMAPSVPASDLPMLIERLEAL